MASPNFEPAVVPVHVESDLILVRQAVRIWTSGFGFSLVSQTKMITAASELARNLLKYGGGGEVRLAARQEGIRHGLVVTFEDQGPGIADIALALSDGYTSGGGLGLGLGGSRRLVDDFDIVSTLGAGTRVTITRWK
jgi:serine/threonine-protein kinase RsbT